jgi:hypothetical protein
MEGRKEEGRRMRNTQGTILYPLMPRQRDCRHTTVPRSSFRSSSFLPLPSLLSSLLTVCRLDAFEGRGGEGGRRKRREEENRTVVLQIQLVRARPL